MTDDVIRVLVQNCTKLRSLNVALCSHVTDSGVELIAKHANNIDKLYLVACRITDKGFVILNNRFFDNLQRLNWLCVFIVRAILITFVRWF